MCLNMRMTEEEEEEWLKDKPKNVIAYKAVSEENNKIYPIYYRRGTGPFQKINKLKEREMDSFVVMKGPFLSKYVPNYHFFELKRDAQKWAIAQSCCSNPKIFKCTIPKDQITTVGWQNDFIAIVAKEFTFVEGDEYFNEILNEEE